MDYVVYVLRCADDSLYIGHTDDLQERLSRHNRGEGSSFTACRRPVTLVYSEAYSSRPAASARERQLKRWSRSKKEALAAGDLSLLKRL